MNAAETKALAESMNVSVSDLMSLAKATASSMTEDGVTAEQVSPELATAYTRKAVRKSDRFCTAYLTSAASRQAVINHTYEAIK